MSDLHPSHAQAVGVLFQHHYHWLCGRLRRYLQCHAHAEDIAAETFAQVLQAPQAAPIREPRALLTTIAQRLMYQGLRRRDLERAYLQALTLEEQHAPSAEHLAQVLQTLEHVDRLLDRLPAKIKATFLLSMVDGITYLEIANTLGISVSSVKQYMLRAMQRCYQAGLE